MNGPIEREIENIGANRLWGRVWRMGLLVLVLFIIAKLALGPGANKALRAIAAYGFGGFIFGLAGSLLARKQRRVLTIAFILVPIALAIGLFLCRTLFGMDDRVPLYFAASPVAFSLCFLVACKVAGYR